MLRAPRWAVLHHAVCFQVQSPGWALCACSYVLLPTPSLQLGTVVAALAGRAAAAPSAPAAEGAGGGQSRKMLQLTAPPSSEGAGESTGGSPAVSISLNGVVRQPMCGNGFCEVRATRPQSLRQRPAAPRRGATACEGATAHAGLAVRGELSQVRRARRPASGRRSWGLGWACPAAPRTARCPSCNALPPRP